MRGTQSQRIKYLLQHNKSGMKIIKCPAKYNRITLVLAVALPLLVVSLLSAPALAAPIITLEPTSGAVGTQVTVTGVNFESYRGDRVFIFFDDEEINSSLLTIPQEGSFNIELTIPADAAPGRHWISLEMEGGVGLVIRNFFIVPETTIDISRLTGTVGTAVTIEGEGFYVGKMVTLQYYNRTGERLDTEVASATGEFSFQFTIPASAAGKHKITAENAEGNSAEAEFEVIPTTTLNLTSGTPGDLLTVKGNGFSHRSDISIYFDSTEMAYAKTDEYGSFEATFNVPDRKSASYIVKAIDEDDNTDKANFAITAGASLDKKTGYIGTTVTVIGSGFATNETVTVNYDSLQVATTITDNGGDFSIAFNIPQSAGGNHLITVSDDDTIKQLSFAVELTAPPIPALLLPANASETQAKAYFDWESVSDPSLPVTYSLQVASDHNFASVVLAQEGLTSSEYTLTEDEILDIAAKKTTYYWRVKATDGAYNEREWSTPWSFYVATPPTPAPLLPEIDIKADAQIHFDWEDAISLNPPVNYTLQIASDLDFTDIILQKEGLTESEYILTEEEELAAVKKEAPYYWRVKVTDSAAAESDWSEPWPFSVGFSFSPPGWVIYILIAVGAFLIGFLAFWLGRRTAYYQRPL